MAETATLAPTAANNPSPAPAPSPAEAGLGGSGAEQGGAESATPTNEYAKQIAALEEQSKRFQAERDRAVNQTREFQRRYGELGSEHAAALARLEAIEAKIQAPDPLMAPEESARYWQDQFTREKTRVRTEQKISAALQALARDTGAIVTRDDRRLDFSSEQAFYRSVNNIRTEIVGARTAKQTQAEARKALEAEIREKAEKEIARKYGLDRFDGGSSSGGSGLTMAKYLGMSSAERTQLRRTNPGAIDALMQRGR